MKYLIYVIIGFALIIVGVMIIRACNTEVIKATENTPIVSTIVSRIVHRMPKVVQPPTQDEEGFKEVIEGPNRFMVNPRFDVGIGMGTSLHPSRKDMIPKVGIGVSIASYGKNKMDTKYRFLRVGVQTNTKTTEVTVSPIMVRLGSEKHPLLSNTYIHPYASVHIPSGTLGAGVGLSISF